MSQIAEQQGPMLTNLTAADARRIPGHHPWLDVLRRTAAARFEKVGLPGPRDEQWRFTNLSSVTKKPFKLARPDESAVAGEFSFGDAVGTELVFVNGHYAPHLSKLGDLPRNVKVASLSDVLTSDGRGLEQVLGQYANLAKNPFVALNTANIFDGAFLYFPKNTTVESPIHLLFLSTVTGEPTVSHPRVVILAEDNVEAAVVETYAGTSGEYFTNAVTEIVLGNDCRIDHNKLNQESVQASHIATMQVSLGRNSQFVSHSTTLGAKLTRNDLNCVMAGERAYATLNGLVVIGGDQHCDNHTLLDHQEPNCPSHELYKHVISSRATAVFKGQIYVAQKAQKTDSKQNSKTLLLSPHASMNSMPALEIYADDVKCTHGSTTGPVDEDQVFYLQSRGLTLDAARHLMTYAFAADVTRRIKVEAVRARIEDYLSAQHGLPQDLRINDLGAFDEAVT